MASIDPGKFTLEVKVDEASYQKAESKLRTLAALAREARPPSPVREFINNAVVIFVLLWLGAVIGHLAGW